MPGGAGSAPPVLLPRGMTLAPPLLDAAARRGFARRRVARPVVIFLALATLYAGLVVLTLAAPLPLALVLTVLCGVVIGQLFIVGHDACHNSLTASAPLNRVLGRLAFLPSLHSFSLWDLAHNRTHHRHNNVRGWDYVWEPMTVAEYHGHARWRRALYRFYRTPVGVAYYYLIEIWAPKLLFPRPSVVGRMTRTYVIDTIIVLTFLAAQVWAVTLIGGMLGRGVQESLLVGVVIPFLVWNAFMSFIIFLHHTHPAVPWYPSVAAWQADRGQINGTAHVRFPWGLGRVVLAIMEHNAHHLASGVPLYNLPDMQRALAGSTEVVSWRFSWRAYRRVCQRCKLFDYEQRRWTGFDSTSRP